MPLAKTVSTYIGIRGYTIYKSALSVQDQRWIRETLRVTPFTPGAPGEAPSFDVYRESPAKFYLPRYFGVEHFGPPDSNLLPDSSLISCPFVGELRDYQIPVVKSFLCLPVGERSGIIDLPCGYGKTSCALFIACKLGKKTLVIVHKTFLLTQWEERINQFVPSARVGRIQGETYDVDGKDIVIGMLQSLSMKNYPKGAFSQFGLTIIDECHHMPSNVFSRALNKIETDHTLGLSATVDRKDGLTRVLKMFIGDVVYTKKREPQSCVEVRRLEYLDAELLALLSEDSTDYRGKVKYSGFISKLCASTGRTQFIHDTIVAELGAREGQQILVLSQHKVLLADLAKLLDSAGVEWGFYIGGMKQVALEGSSRKRVILATYTMASEGLDIKTLTTLVLATPRTDIVQAVGRIMRSNHARPLIMDIVDGHGVLLNQWRKRLTYYKKNKYRVRSASSHSWRDPAAWSEIKPRPRRTKSHANKCVL